MSAPLCDEVPYGGDTTVIISTVLEPSREGADEYRWGRAPQFGWGGTENGSWGQAHAGGIDLGGDSTTPSAHRFVRETRSKASEASDGASTDDSCRAVRHLRDRSGLTFEQLGRAMQVDKRSLHNWAGGAPTSASKRERLQRLVALVDFIDRGFIDQTSRALLSPTSDGRIVLDWLAEGRDDEVKRLLGQGRGPQPGGSRLSLEERERRRPPHPVALLDTLGYDPPTPLEVRRVVAKLRGPA